ncbi:putative ribosome-binding factor A, chloroplastic [Vitis vinifera]|uniref:Putative ribosome-binding factor A, chloroplastic n=1 Tax=Vitis vinifera TaxID=29760 RepID=A0A438I9E4_VITVI|nr:putative ribosome-binding factor A, chloroplastic [Vitis vinifera]RVW93343.1 putative ribosome-binding factor A, chloroplastic [Vitis vinifera]
MLHLSLYHRHAPLPHHHRRSSSITTSTTKSCPLFRRTPSTAMEVHVAGPHQIATVRCMANQRRVKMVAKQIRRELSDMLLTDKVLQFAVLPEAALGADRYLSSLTTISDVEVSADLQVVKVYVSVFGDEKGKEVAIAGLKSKAKYVRSELGRRMKLRLTPEIRFVEDESLERGSRVIAILDRIKNEKKMAGSQDQPSESSDLPQDDDWEGDGDDPDENIIYIK